MDGVLDEQVVRRATAEDRLRPWRTFYDFRRSMPEGQTSPQTVHSANNDLPFQIFNSQKEPFLNIQYTVWRKLGAPMRQISPHCQAKV